MGRLKILAKKGFNKIKENIKEELKKSKEIRDEIQELNDKQLKNLAITKGKPYEDAWIKRQKQRKRLDDRMKNI